MGWLSFWRRSDKPKPEPERLEWQQGLHRNGGESLVNVQTGRILGHAYKLDRTWWSIVDCSARGQYTSMEHAKRAVEREITCKHLLTYFSF